jgi:hypothetical protein
MREYFVYATTEKDYYAMKKKEFMQGTHILTKAEVQKRGLIVGSPVLDQEKKRGQKILASIGRGFSSLLNIATMSTFDAMTLKLKINHLDGKHQEAERHGYLFLRGKQLFQQSTSLFYTWTYIHLSELTNRRGPVMGYVLDEKGILRNVHYSRAKSKKNNNRGILLKVNHRKTKKKN